MLNLPTDKTKFESQLRKIWFDLYNNYFGDVSVRDASGFEHIFVGEGKYDFANPINNKILGAISGYHSWVKFYLDEKQQQVNYLGQAFPALQRRGLRLTAYRGHNYDLQGNIGVDNPYVVTVQMLRQQCHYVVMQLGCAIARIIWKLHYLRKKVVFLLVLVQNAI